MIFLLSFIRHLVRTHYLFASLFVFLANLGLCVCVFLFVARSGVAISILVISLP